MIQYLKIVTKLFLQLLSPIEFLVVSFVLNSFRLLSEASDIEPASEEDMAVGW